MKLTISGRLRIASELNLVLSQLFIAAHLVNHAVGDLNKWHDFSTSVGLLALGITIDAYATGHWPPTD